MAKWNVGLASPGNTLSGGIEYNQHGSQWRIEQNINPYLEEAKKDRDLGDGVKHYTKMYTIPDIVAIEIKQKYGIDVFSPEFMHDKEQKAKVHLIMQQEYSKLLSTDKKI